MTSKRADSCLILVKDKVQQKFPKLFFQPRYVKNNVKSLMASQHYLDNQDHLLGILPSLWVVIETYGTTDEFTIITRLVNFQGTIIDSENFDSEQLLSHSKFLQSLNDGDVAHCQGISWLKEEMN